MNTCGAVGLPRPVRRPHRRPTPPPWRALRPDGGRQTPTLTRRPNVLDVTIAADARIGETACLDYEYANRADSPDRHPVSIAASMAYEATIRGENQVAELDAKPTTLKPWPSTQSRLADDFATIQAKWSESHGDIFPGLRWGSTWRLRRDSLDGPCTAAGTVR